MGRREQESLSKHLVHKVDILTRRVERFPHDKVAPAPVLIAGYGQTWNENEEEQTHTVHRLQTRKCHTKSLEIKK